VETTIKRNKKGYYFEYSIYLRQHFYIHAVFIMHKIKTKII